MNLLSPDDIAADVVRFADQRAIGDVVAELACRHSSGLVLETLQDLIAEEVLGLEPEPPARIPEKPNSGLRQISLNLTHNCNLRCRYCYGDGGGYGSPGEKMSPATAEAAVDFLFAESSPDEPCKVIFFGGEPLLCMDVIKSTVAYGRDLAERNDRVIEFSMTTNGLLLTEEVVAFLDEHRIVVQISIDGPREIQDANRPALDGGGSYDRTVAGAARLIANRPSRVGARCTLSAGEFDLQTITTHLVGMGFGDVHVEPAEGCLASLAMQDSDYERLKHQMDALADEACHPSSDRTGLKLSNLTVPLRKLHEGLRSPYLCGAGRTLIAVAPNGDLFPCHRFVGDSAVRLGSLAAGRAHVSNPFGSC